MAPSPRTVLVVDDFALFRGILKQMFHHLGPYHILEAADGPTALQGLYTQPVNLVTLDWYLGPMSGLALLKAIRADPRRAQILIGCHQDDMVGPLFLRIPKANHTGVQGHLTLWPHMSPGPSRGRRPRAPLRTLPYLPYPMRRRLSSTSQRRAVPARSGGAAAARWGVRPGWWRQKTV